MPKMFLKGLWVVTLVVFVYGCSSSSVAVRGYVQDKEREDQQMEGNAGYLLGTPQPRGPVKPTRKVYILEVIKEDRNKSKEETATASSAEVPRAVETPETSIDTRETYSPPQISLPGDEEQTTSESSEIDPVTGSGEMTEYVIEKDDTLQKISKKFYNGYGKWIKIYNANRDVIKNPDRLKPGTVIKIPKE